MNLNLRVTVVPKTCISSNEVLYIIIAKEDAAYG